MNRTLLLSLALAGCLADTGTLVHVPNRITSGLEPLVAELPAPYQALRPEHKLLYAYLADADWTYPRHHVSGLILRREISAVFAYQDPKGQCGVELLVVGQESLGNDRFGPVAVSNVTGPDGYPRYLYRHGPCSQLTANEDVLRQQGCPQCVVGEPAAAKPAS